MLLDKLCNKALPLPAALFGSCVYGSKYEHTWKKLVDVTVGENMFA